MSLAKRKKRVPKNGAVWHLSAEEATLAKMPKFNGHACGTGIHGDTKYNRSRSKRAWKQELARETRNRGSHSFGKDIPLVWRRVRAADRKDLCGAHFCVKRTQLSHSLDFRLSIMLMFASFLRMNSITTTANRMVTMKAMTKLKAWMSRPNMT